MVDHDRSYKLLFSHPEMVRDLLEGFVREDWLAQVDYTSFEKLNSAFVSDDLRERADDVVWRVRWGDGLVYVYLLLEFQSSVERYMAVRVLAYVALLYQDLIRTKQVPEDGSLPPVFPIVLYNGSRAWHAAQDVTSLMQPGPPALQRYSPQLRYTLIDAQRLGQNAATPAGNLAAALFRLESSRTHADVAQVIVSLAHWLRTPEQSSLRRAFTVWVARFILRKHPTAAVHGLNELREAHTMYDDDLLESWKERWVKWKQADQQEGEARMLTRQLEKRFGSLKPEVRQRLERAEIAQLESWAERIFDADSLEALLGEARTEPIT
jgi:putative YhgA-like transposase/uncharacterized protein DUF4351